MGTWTKGSVLLLRRDSLAGVKQVGPRLSTAACQLGILAGGLTSPSCGFLSGVGSDTTHSIGPGTPRPPAPWIEHNLPAGKSPPLRGRSRRSHATTRTSTGPLELSSVGCLSPSSLAYSLTTLLLSLSFLLPPFLSSFKSSNGTASQGRVSQGRPPLLMGRNGSRRRLAWRPTVQPGPSRQTSASTRLPHLGPRTALRLPTGSVCVCACVMTRTRLPFPGTTTK